MSIYSIYLTTVNSTDSMNHIKILRGKFMSENKLVRKMSFWHIWAIGVGSVVGDGIFVLIAQGAQVSGPSSIIAYFIAGLLMMVIMISIAVLAVGMPKAGSLHSWSSRMLGPGIGTVTGLSYIAMNVIFLGSVSIANGAISNYFFQWTASPALSAAIWAVLLVSLVSGIALLGGNVTGRTQLVLVIGLTSVMLLFSIFGSLSGKIDITNYTPFMPFGFKGLWAAIGMGIYAYIGPLSLLTAGSEVKKVTDLPKAMFWSVITFLVIYTTSMIVMIGLVNFGSYATMESPYTAAAQSAFGRGAGLIMNLAAWVAAFTCLVGEVFASSRLLFGMAEEGAVPKVFMKLNKNSVPFVGVIFAWSFAMVMIIIGNIKVIEAFYLELAMIACEIGAMAWFFSLLSASLYKKKFPDEYNALPWHIPGRSVLLPLAFLGWGVVMFALYSSDPPSIIYSAIAMLIFVLVYQLYSKKHLNPEV